MAFWLTIFVLYINQLVRSCAPGLSTLIILRNISTSRLLLYAALIILVCLSQDLYRVLSLRTRLDECYAVTKSVAIATFALSVFLYLVGAKPISRLLLGVCATLSVITLIGWRLFRRFYVERRTRQGYGVRNALIIGTGEIAHLLAEILDQKPSLGWVVVGFLDESRLSDPRRRATN